MSDSPSLSCRNFLIMSYFSEMQVIYTIQEYRNPLFDAFFKFLNYFDSSEFFFVLLPAIWVGINWKSGLKLFYILVLSSFTNYFFKDLFALPRPFDLDPSVALIYIKGYGLPSGAAQTAALLSSLLITFWKSFWRWPVAICYFALLSFSRLYLGVHFPTDLLGGWVIGFALFGLFIYAIPPIEKQLQKQSPLFLLLLSQVVPLSWFLGQSATPISKMAGSAMGLSLGAWISYTQKWTLSVSKTMREFLGRAILAALGAAACYFIASILGLPSFWKSWIAGLWVAAISYFICSQSD